MEVPDHPWPIRRRPCHLCRKIRKIAGWLIFGIGIAVLFAPIIWSILK